ncbi:serotonin receptor-like protein [Daphnia pulex]|uniref:Serotonin receptor-like protein n=1 Tax=Daphnia pulex TaxID=6669 RepID=E9FYY2_DAPPU|nr:serotonin receptor-like protein [Daphnia pulex]|eukprot:EFX87693.1 serotonin receptor-like protein [Daphnia pulex]
MAGNQSRSLAAAGQEPPQYLNLSSWPVDASSYYNYLLHYCNNNSTPAAAAAAAACCEWNNCSVAGNIFLEVAGANDDNNNNNNNSGNASDYWINSTNPQRPEDNLIFTSLTSAILGVLILATIVGNVFVIAAILLERHLHSVANYLIVSLAVADLLVACLVMPLGAVYEISQRWILGPELCDMWTSSDVLCCTASILHLVAIATDRYWAVTNLDYIHNRNVSRIGTMIFLVWAVALIVSVAPLFGWKDAEFLDRVNIQQRCLISQDVSYQIFATCATFYVPLAVILIVYWKIFQTARRRIRKQSEHIKEDEPPARTSTDDAMAIVAADDGGQHTPNQQTTAFTIEIPDSPLNGSTVALSSSPVIIKTPSAGPAATARTTENAVRKKRETLEAKRERKAAKTLAIITGAFVVCWLPFFVCALLMPLRPDWVFDETMLSVFLWLGYFNSTLNPIIYTIFSPEFRQAFKRLLCGKAAVNGTSAYRPRKLR